MVPIPKGFHEANPELSNILYTFIIKENKRSLSDFGAGVGSCWANLEQEFPTLVYDIVDLMALPALKITRTVTSNSLSSRFDSSNNFTTE